VKAEGKFGMAEAVVLLTMSNMARIFLSFPRSLVETAGPAAWLSALAGLSVALAHVYLIYMLLKPHPESNIVDVTYSALGRILGIPVNLLYAAFFISVAALFTRTFSEALLISALPDTPISVVSTGYIAMGLMGAYIGLESLARAARLTYPFVVGGVAFLLLSLIPNWEITNLFPVLGNGPADVFLKGGIIAGATSEILLAAVIVQSFHGSGMFGMVAARAMIMGFSYLILLVLVIIMVTGWNTSQEFTLPFYQVSRLIYLGRFFQRVESIFIIIWGFIGMVKVALTLYAAAVVLAGTFRLPDHRPLIWPLALVIFTVSLLPPDMPTTVKIEGVIIRQYAWLPTFVLPVIVLAVDRIRRKRKGVKKGSDANEGS
jgi:spore germination protein (amino acid permease)